MKRKEFQKQRLRLPLTYYYSKDNTTKEDEDDAYDDESSTGCIENI